MPATFADAHTITDVETKNVRNKRLRSNAFPRDLGRVFKTIVRVF